MVLKEETLIFSKDGWKTENYFKKRERKMGIINSTWFPPDFSDYHTKSPTSLEASSARQTGMVDHPTSRVPAPEGAEVLGGV